LEELLANVKSHLGITEDDEDINKNIKLKTMATIGYLVDGGAIIDIDKVNEISDKIVVCIAVGVNDLLNNTPGETKFSPAFDILSRQICVSR